MMHTILKTNKVVRSNSFTFWILVSATICFFALLFMGVPKGYEELYFEPVVFFIVFITFINPRILFGTGSQILVLLYFLKLCVLPLTTIMGEFHTSISETIYSRHWTEACIYIALEWLIVAASLKIASKKLYSRLQTIERKDSLAVERDNRHVFWNFIMIVLLIACGALLSFFSGGIFRYELYWIWGVDTTRLASVVGGPYYYLFKTILEIVKPMALFWVTIKVNNSSLKHGKIGITIIIAFITGALLTEYRLLSLLTSVSIVVYIILKNVDRVVISKAIKISSVIVVGIAIYWIITGGNSLNRTLQNIGRVMDNYCGGYIVAAGSCNVHLKNGLHMFYNDIKAGSYLLSSISDDIYTTTDAINEALNSSARGSFYEMMIQCKDFFGIFAPLAIYACVYFVVKMDYLSFIERDELYKIMYLFCAVGTAVTMFMYTYSMIVNFIIYKCLIWLTIIWIDKHWRGRSVVI